jgi:zona occludens toxin
MISYIVGIPGSGKTALAVDYILKHKKDGKKDGKYTTIYQNINQFDYKKIKNCFPLDWDKLYDNLSQLYMLHKQKSTDDELLKVADDFDLVDVLIVIDECHNYLDKRDSILIWWLSYHRHLRQDIFLITQNLALVDSKYKAFAEVFYKAVPPLLRWRHHVLKYNLYSSSKMTKTDKFEVFKLNTKTNNVFKFYKSGANSKNKSVLLKFILMSFTILVIAFFFFKMTFGRYIPDSKPKSPPVIPPPQNKTFISSQFKMFDFNKSEKYTDMHILINFHCVDKICYINNKRFSFSEIVSLVNNTNSLFLPVSQSQKINYTNGAFLASPTLQHILGVLDYEDESITSRSGLPVITNQR